MTTPPTDQPGRQIGIRRPEPGSHADGGGTYIRRPRTSPPGFTPLQVARAYNYPAATGQGYTAGIIELGGGFTQDNLTAYFAGLGIAAPRVVSKPVAGGSNTTDGPNGADGEVDLDIEVIGAIAPGATINVYFAPNTDNGFAAAIQAAIADQVHAISISWGGPESSWNPAAIRLMEKAFTAAKAAGIQVFAASGDSGSSDSTRGNAVDYPASSPNVAGCGGTRLTVDASGQRATESTWNDNPATSATGGGASVLFPGRDVPDVAGNADPETGYQILIDGQRAVIGGTSAVAPLYTGLYLRLLELTGGVPFDLVATVAANPATCYDVTTGDNGAFRAGPGRDQTTGFGVVDGTRLLAVLQAAVTAPPSVPPAATPRPADLALAAAIPADWLKGRHTGEAARVAAAIRTWEKATGVTSQ